MPLYAYCTNKENKFSTTKDESSNTHPSPLALVDIATTPRGHLEVKISPGLLLLSNFSGQLKFIPYTVKDNKRCQSVSIAGLGNGQGEGGHYNIMKA